MSKEYRFETKQLHSGQVIDKETKSRAVPIYASTSFVFDSSDEAEKLFSLQGEGYTYSRIGNPTNTVFEKRVAELEGGIDAVGFGSGIAAITAAIITLAGTGDEIVSSSTVYGGTYNLFQNTFKSKYGIKTTFVDGDDVSNFEKSITEKTKALYIESIGNPGINIIDIKAVSDIAHKHGIPLIVDNTFATPYLLRPFEHGADIVVHSATKFIGGHGTVIGGILVDSGKFDWTQNDKFKSLVEEDPTYNNVSFTKTFKEAAYITKARVQILRDTGASLSPFNAFLLLQGLETLSLRMERHVENAKKIAEYLSENENVEWVNYPGLKNNKYYDLAEKYLEKGAGAILSFGIKGGEEKARKFIDNLEIFSDLANVGDSKSLVIHPASTTHQQLSDEDQIKAGVTKNAIRLSIGTENIQDLIEDIESAFKGI